MSQQLSQGVQIMQAVSDQKNYFSELSFNFGKKLKVGYLNILPVITIATIVIINPLVPVTIATLVY